MGAAEAEDVLLCMVFNPQVHLRLNQESSALMPSAACIGLVKQHRLVIGADLLADGLRCKADSGEDGRDAKAKASFWRGSADGEEGWGLMGAGPSENDLTCSEVVFGSLYCSWPQ